MSASDNTRDWISHTRAPISPEFVVSYFSLKSRRSILKRLHQQMEALIGDLKPRHDPLLPMTWAMIAELDAQLFHDRRTAPQPE